MRAMWVACAVLLTTSAVSRAQVEVEVPLGGWKRGSLTEASDDRAVAYPPALVDRGLQRGRTLIRGHLDAAGPDRPGTLIVNGNPMPLYTGDDGRFARPYVFGFGSNSVEVRGPGGAGRKRVQFYESDPTRPQARVRVILSWDDNQAEVDLHVLTPDGQHAFWAHPVLTHGGGLDVDSVDGAGPEMFSMAGPLHGTYHVYVNYWGNFGASGYHFDESSRRREVITTLLTLVFDENTGREKRETFLVPLRKIGDLTLVKTFLY